MYGMGRSNSSPPADRGCFHVLLKQSAILGGKLGWESYASAQAERKSGRNRNLFYLQSKPSLAQRSFTSMKIK